MSEIAHTPTPWVAGWGNGLTGPTTPERPVTVAGKDWDYEPVSVGYETIAICPNQVAPWSLRNEAKGTGEANAAFIVTAVNAYDKHVSLIQELISALEHARQNMQHPDQMIDDTLATAKKEGF